jgi:hypothetical protein
MVDEPTEKRGFVEILLRSRKALGILFASLVAWIGSFTVKLTRLERGWVKN